MNERAIVAGLLSGRLSIVDTHTVDVHSFRDRSLGRCFFAVETLLMSGRAPTASRVLVAFEAMGWPQLGVAELIAELAEEG